MSEHVEESTDGGREAALMRAVRMAVAAFPIDDGGANPEQPPLG